MKASTIIKQLALLESVRTTAASPLTTSRDLVVVPPKVLSVRQQVELQVDCNKLVDQIVGILETHPQYSARVYGIGKSGLAGVTAYALCKTFKTETIDCRMAGLTVAGGLSLAVLNSFLASDDPPTEGSTAATPTSRDLHERLAARLEAHLRSGGFSFESVSALPSTLRRDDGTGLVSRVVEVRGMSHPDSELDTDFQVGTRDDGVGYVQAKPSTYRTLDKRADGPGYKIAWHSYDRKHTVTKSAYEGLSSLVGDDWAARVRADHGMGDYVGKLDFAGIGDLRFRIIPEAGGFGSNYEDVNTCSE